MAIYRVQAPDGSIIRIEGPDNATDEQLAQAVAAYAQTASVPAGEAEQEAAQPSLVNQIPLDTGMSPPRTGPEPLPPAAPTSIGDEVLGALETGASLVTGATGGTIGMLGGLAKNIIEGGDPTAQTQRERELAAERAMLEGAAALTYTPRTAAGQRNVQAIGEAAQALIPVSPLTAELGMLGRSAAPVAAAARDAARVVPPAATQAARITGDTVKKAVDAVLGKEPGAGQPTPGTMGSVGAAGTDMATQRRQLAADLPVPIDLTKGQANRNFEQLRFEKETAKDPGAGAPLRNRFDDQNEAILRNFDAWLDQTGAQAPDLVAAGRFVDKALLQRARRDKNEIRVAYKNAEKAGELAEPVQMDQLVNYLNESTSAESLAPILSAVRKELIRLGGAEVDAAGNLIPRELSLNNAENLRKLINRGTGADPTNQLYAGELKGVIDASTEGLGGDLYKRARSLRQRYAERYENRAIVSQLMTTKRGSQDRRVAFEDVFEKTMLNGSQEDIRFLRRVLQTGGDDGKQAWRELQGATINWIREEATKNVATDQRGNQIVSASGLDRAIKRLDHDGKLDFIFGKKGAQQLRDINDLTKLVYTTPPGAVNTSNTASVLIAALTEAGVTGSMTGLPVPVLTAMRMLAIRVKDKRIQKRVEEALQEAKRNEERPSTGVTMRPSRTLH